MLRSNLHLVWRALGMWSVLACGSGCFSKLDPEPAADEDDASSEAAPGANDAEDATQTETEPVPHGGWTFGPRKPPYDTDGPNRPGQAPSAVDVLFVIDDSGSMTEEQKKINAILGDLVESLSSGRKRRDGPAEFPGVESLHIGVVSTDMGVNGAQPQKSCGSLSFLPTERNPASAHEFLVKPLGDDGVLLTSTAVASAGIWGASAPGAAPIELVPGDPSCGDVSFPANRRYIDYTAGDDATAAAQAFRCIAKLGKNGCGLEQQLEAGLKALTPSDSKLLFSNGTHGNGTASAKSHKSGPNAGFLREDALLAIVFLSDEEDCSIPDSSNAMFDATSSAIAGEINVRCGLKENQRYLHDVQERYVAGLKALKPAAYQDRIFVASVVGIPVAANSGAVIHRGTDALDALLARSDMQFRVQRNAAGTADEPVPTCISAKGDGSAAPARRFLELTKAFAENGLVTSICEDDYAALAAVLIERLGLYLGGT